MGALPMGEKAFPREFLNELRRRVLVSQLVGEKVELKRRGKEFVGLSPFTDEKTPSFTVNDHRQFWKDFSSGRRGDIFGFLMQMDGIEFPEAVRRIAQKAGVPLPAQTSYGSEKSRNGRVSEEEDERPDFK